MILTIYLWLHSKQIVKNSLITNKHCFVLFLLAPEKDPDIQDVTVALNESVRPPGPAIGAVYNTHVLWTQRMQTTENCSLHIIICTNGT